MVNGNHFDLVGRTSERICMAMQRKENLATWNGNAAMDGGVEWDV